MLSKLFLGEEDSPNLSRKNFTLSAATGSIRIPPRSPRSSPSSARLSKALLVNSKDILAKVGSLI